MPFFVSFLTGILLFYLFNFFPFLCAAFFISASVRLIFKKRILLILVIVIGILYAFIRFSPPLNDSVDIWTKEINVTGRFVPGAGIKSTEINSETFAIDKAIDEETGEEIKELHGEDINLLSDYEADYDEEYELLIKTSKDRTRFNPGGFTGGRLYASIITANETKEASYSIVSDFNKYRNKLNNYVMGKFNEDSAALVSAITTGETSYLSDDVREAFNVTGLAHILSISGTHFGLFSVMLFGIFSFLIKRLPFKILQRLTIYLTPSQASAMLCIPLMIMYLGISGSSPPAVRSFVMISLFLAGLLLGRKGFWLNSLSFAAVILAIWNPIVILSFSFQLSFMAVLFIGFSIGKKDVEKDDGNKNRLISFIKNSVLLTLAATIGTSPLTAYHFHYFSVISPLSNLIVTPLICFILVPLSLISSFSFLIAGHYILGSFVEMSADASISIVKLISKMPFADLKVPAFPPILCITFYFGTLMYFVFGRKKKILIISLVPFVIYALLNVFEKRELSVTFLDVGQGDSAVIELPDNKAILIDTGRTGKEAAAFLKYNGKRSIDALVLSHIHPDHTGGIEYIMKKFKPVEIWDNGRIEYPQGIMNSAKHRMLERGDITETENYKITVLHPYKEFYTLSDSEYEEENNSSLVLKISGKKTSFLFTGDIQDEAEEDISYLGKRLQSDVIKIPHHGSKTSVNDRFLLEVSPTIAVISVGRQNSFGHPSQEAINKLSGKKIFRTDFDGAVKITETEKGLVSKTYRESTFERADNIDKELKNIKMLFSKW